MNRTELIQEAEGLIAQADAEGRDLTAAEASRIDELCASVQTLTNADSVAGLSTSRGRRTSPDSPRNSQAGSRRPGRSGMAFRNAATGEPVRALTRTERLVEVPDDVQFGNIVHAMLTNSVDTLTPGERKLFNASTSSSDSDGGYLLNPAVSSMVVDLARARSVAMRAGAQTLPMTTGELSIARLSGDVTTSWRGETVAITASSPTFDKVVLRPKVLAAIVPVSIELLEDAANSGAVIESAISAALAQKLDQAILQGSGAGSEPTGVRNHADVNTIATVGTPSDWSDVTAAVGDVLEDDFPGDVSELAWVAAPRTFETFDGLTDSTGQPLQPTPWASELQRFATTSVDTDEGGGSNESYMIVGDFTQVVVGMRTSGVVIQVLDSGSVTDANSTSWNAASQMLRHVRAYMRADVALLQPTWFTVSTGITA